VAVPQPDGIGRHDGRKERTMGEEGAHDRTAGKEGMHVRSVIDSAVWKVFFLQVTILHQESHAISKLS
jgi:hypothetical protein